MAYVRSEETSAVSEPLVFLFCCILIQ